MKIFLVILLFLGLFYSEAFALQKNEEEVLQVRNKIVRIQKEIKRLEKKLKGRSSAARKKKLKQLINGHSARIEVLEGRIARKTKPKEIALPATREAAENVQPESEKVIHRKTQRESVKGQKFEIGATFGVLAGATGINGELRFPLQHIFGPATTSFRIASGLAQSRDAGRRYVPLQLDAVLNFPPGVFSGVENYLGAGLNYVVITRGWTSGTIGGEVFYGVESKGFAGKLFGEIGYAMLRTGSSPSHSGVTVLIGYRFIKSP